MNSINRARSRPRVDSVSFQSFAWVLVREALVNVLLSPGGPVDREPLLRRWVAGLPTDRVRKFGERMLACYPHWRIK